MELVRRSTALPVDHLPPPLLKWYERNARPLPWRSRPTPYRTWISEIMLQQTRVETVIPYYRRWMARFPSVRAVAAATEQEILGQWEGLGYYSRARSLHRAAQIIVKEFGGALPPEMHLLRKLPGIGTYTAAAIASIAFGADVPALDGNIRRVLSRVFNVRFAPGSVRGESRLNDLAQLHLPKGRAGAYNQALMDLGAIICLPARPRCNECPVARLCEARRLGIQERLPRTKRRPQLPHRIIGAAVIVRGGAVLIGKRPSNGLLGGLWHFPQVTYGGSSETASAVGRALPAAFATTFGINIRTPALATTVHHAYTHFKVTVHAFQCDMPARSIPRGFEWVQISRLTRYPMGKVDRLVAGRLT